MTTLELYLGYRQRIPWKGRKGTPRNLRSRFGSLGQTFDPKSFIWWIQSFLLENEGWLFPIFGWSCYRTKEKGHHERVTRSLQGCLRSCPEGNASKLTLTWPLTSLTKILANSPNQTWFGFELLRLLLRDFEWSRSGLQVSKNLWEWFINPPMF